MLFAFGVNGFVSLSTFTGDAAYARYLQIQYALDRSEHVNVSLGQDMDGLNTYSAAAVILLRGGSI
jgi:hypothetical protein